MLNAICGDLARQINWHGCRLDKDDWRHLLSGTAAGWRAVPTINQGDGQFGIVLLGSSSLKLTKQQAQGAITQGLVIGDDPSSQGLKAQPVRWSDAVLLGLGHNPNDFRDVA
ncbi:NinB protein [Lysobacter enzymogenes]|nr:NinB protein [Lysobacter enzymogenes]